MVDRSRGTRFCLSHAKLNPCVVTLLLLLGLHQLLPTIAQELNVALQSRGATCRSYPEHDPSVPESRPCRGAIDGLRNSDPRYQWTFFGDPRGAWLQINLNSTYYISLVRVLPVYYAKDRTFNNVTIEFDDNSNVSQPFDGSRGFNMTLGNLENGWVWEQASLHPPESARRVRLTVLSSHIPSLAPGHSPGPDIDFSQIRNGLTEVEYLGLDHYDPPEVPTTTDTVTSPSTTMSSVPLTSQTPQSEPPDPTTLAPSTSEWASVSHGEGIGTVGVALVAVSSFFILIMILAVILYIVTRHSRNSKTLNGPFSTLSAFRSKSPLSDVIAYPSPADEETPKYENVNDDSN